MNRIIWITWLTVFGGLSFQVRAEDTVDAVTVKDAQTYSIQDNSLTLLTEKIKFPADIEIETNGSFHIASGKERNLEKGQILRRDGWLLDADGSVEPAFDHLAMKAGKVIIVRDGQTETVTQPMSFPNHFQVNPDGSCTYPGGGRSRLRDGQLFLSDGTVIPSKDTVTLKKGRVVVQKDGSLIPLSPVQTMGMNDGTRIQGDGSIRKKDGTVIKLHEDQTILIDGAAVNR